MMHRQYFESTDLCKLPVCPAEHHQSPCLGLRLLRVDDSGADHVVVIGHDADGVLEGYESVAVNYLESMLVNDEEKENLQ